MEVGNSTFAYSFDANGNMRAETTSRHFEFNHADQLKVFRTQTEGAEPSVHAHYLYDASGQRVKKLVRKQGGQVEITHYIDGVFEHHRWGSGAQASENNHIHVSDDKQRIALVRLGPAHPDDRGPAVQFHLGDHLGSSNVIVDEAGALVNREEFTPYGETSFGSFAKKRYRFTGKERDEESGLSYHTARYYAASVGRWTSPDPTGIKSGQNLYAYALGNPVSLIDPRGTDAKRPDETPVDSNASQVDANKLFNLQKEQDSSTCAKDSIINYPLAVEYAEDLTANEKTKADDFAYGIDVRRFAKPERFGGGFEGDNRDFTTNDTASVTSRTEMIMRFNLKTGKIGGYGVASESASVGAVAQYANFISFKHWRGRATADVDVETAMSRTPETVSIYGHSEGALPLVRGAPDIDTFINLSFQVRWESGNRYLKISGMLRGDEFPWGEVIISDPTGHRQMLATYDAIGSPYTSLFGSHKENVLVYINASIRIDSKGRFMSVPMVTNHNRTSGNPSQYDLRKTP
jgi:RHS repeat-associated protein